MEHILGVSHMAGVLICSNEIFWIEMVGWHREKASDTVRKPGNLEPWNPRNKAK